jgi:choline kinase
MKEETDSKPKCLTVLDGQELLKWQLGALKKAGLENLTVVGGYRSEMLTGNFELVRNDRWDKTNMVASLFCVKPYDSDSIISYSDIVYKTEHIEKLKEAKGDIIITADKKWKELWEIRFENPLDDAETFKSKNDELIEIGKKTNDYSEIEAQYMGLLKFTPKGWNLMYDIFMSFSNEKKDKMDMTTMLNELLHRDIPVNVVFIEGGWCEADAYTDIIAYEKALNNTKKWEHDWR